MMGDGVEISAEDCTLPTRIPQYPFPGNITELGIYSAGSIPNDLFNNNTFHITVVTEVSGTSQEFSYYYSNY